MWLGHHSAASTLATYVHLLPDDPPDPSFLDSITANGQIPVNVGSTPPVALATSDHAWLREAPEARPR